MLPGHDIVKLDVGGTVYKTTKSTLLQCSYFSTMFGGNWEVNRDENGDIFIDRDGQLFAYILAFLRGNTILPDDIALLKTIGQEAEFYGIESLASCIAFKLGDNDNIDLRIDTGLIQATGLVQRVITRKTLLDAIEHGFSAFFETALLKGTDLRLVNSIDVAHHHAADMWIILLDAYLFGKAGLMFTDNTTSYRLKQVIALGKRWGVPASTLQCIADHIGAMKLCDSNTESNQ
uniref:BTB domain-containing protein n=1 Tax=Plectus sambesii TaxID=2011161 RepID=A0A914UNM3_9BILA